MQKFKEKLKNSPTNTSLVCSSENSQLNKVEKLSVENIVLSLNNSEENQSQKGKHLILVFVLNKNGKPLMPCSPAKAKRLLKSGKAKVIKRQPFTIQLIYGSSGYKQKITLGVDTGYENVGISCITEKEELFSANVKLRTNISKLLTEKAMYRRERRNKLWYRKPRFLNRGINKGWLAPSVQHRLDSHVRIVEKVKSILPITKIIVEVANFDIQKIENPNIEGIGYQQGNLYGYENVKNYLIAREKGKCQLCGKESTKGNSFRAHHCKQRREEGSNSVKNLALLHEKCHNKLHKKKLKLPAPKSYKAETFMSIIRWKIVERLKEICETEITFGYITKIERNKLGLEKDHYIDAFIIAKGEKQIKTIPFEITQKRRNNRAIQLNRKGFKPAIRKQRYKIQPHDIVWIGNKEYISKGTHCKGTRVLIEELGSKSVKLIERYFNINGWRFMRMHSSPA